MIAEELLKKAVAAQRNGRPDAAAVACRQVLEREPENVAAHNQLALLLYQLGRADEALTHVRIAAQLDPHSAELLNNLGGLLEHTGQLSEAIAVYRRAVKVAPHLAVPQFNLGDALRKDNQPDEALTPLRAAATLDPNLQEAWAALGTALASLNQPQAALGALHRAVELRPTDALTGRRLGDVLQSLRRFDEALARYEQVIRDDPRSYEAWYGLGRTHMEAGRAAAAAKAFEECVALAPRFAFGVHDLGKSLFELGCIERAMTLLRRAADLGENEVRRHALENLAILVPGSPADDNRSILETRQAWGRLMVDGARIQPARQCGNLPLESHAGPLRIGYLSSFFHRPNWMKPVWALINRHDRDRFQLHLFCDAPPQQLEAPYRPHPADRIHDIRRLSDEQAAVLIAEQKLDLLVDLNGYSAPQRLPLCLLRSAPRLVGWFNMYATSGLDCYDYLIGDEHVIPVAEEPFYTEQILRVPHCYLTFEVDYPVPDVGPLPALTGAPFTFGCLASQYKINEQVVVAWSEILKRCPGVRLLIRNKALGESAAQQQLRERFAAQGISVEHLLLEGPSTHFEFLDTYRRIDLALDVFPYSGGTTTMEALWQGVPVVSFNGDRWASRTSVSLLQAAGLGEFVGRSLREYVDLAVNWAADRETLARLAMVRSGLREQLRLSPVCDSTAFAQDMECLYQQIVNSSAPRRI
jgi:protein O-GlcNAc transferase